MANDAQRALSQKDYKRAAREALTRLMSHSADVLADSYAGKRRHTRYSTNLRLEVTEQNPGTSPVVTATAHNFSKDGISFRSKRQFRPGTILCLREWASDQSGVWLTAEVQHCTQGLTGFLIGAAWEPSLFDENS